MARAADNEIPLLCSFLYLLGENESELSQVGLSPVSSLKRRKGWRGWVSAPRYLTGRSRPPRSAPRTLSGEEFD